MPATFEGRVEVALPSGKMKTVPFIIDGPGARQGDDAVAEPSMAVCLLHGAGGDASSGHLPALAAACAAARLPCLSFTSRGGNLEHRIEVCKVSSRRGPAGGRRG